MTKATKLSPFEGKDVLAVGAEISNAAGGLNRAMDVDPIELHHTERVFLVLECEVTKVRHDPVKDTDALRRVHVMSAIAATIVDEDLVRDHLDRQAERIEASQGVHRLPLGATDDDPADDPGDS